MPSASWVNGWLTGDVVTAAEFRKGMGMIADSTLGGSAASIDFTSLPTSYAHLLLLAQLRGDTAANTTALNVRFNNDSGTNYRYGQISSTGATVSTTEQYGQTSINPGSLPANTASGSTPSAVMLFVPNYGSTTFHKTCVGLDMANVADAGPNQFNMYLGAGRWASTSAISRITLLPAAGNFVTGSRVTIYALGA